MALLWRKYEVSLSLWCTISPVNNQILAVRLKWIRGLAFSSTPTSSLIKLPDKDILWSKYEVLPPFRGNLFRLFNSPTRPSEIQQYIYGRWSTKMQSYFVSLTFFSSVFRSFASIRIPWQHTFWTYGFGFFLLTDAEWGTFLRDGAPMC